MYLFLQKAATEPFFYFSWVLVIIVSIVMHELAHGWAAIRRGDDTPINSGHMTGNPLVHMGPMSLICAFVIGIAWGAMPVDPSRIRGKYGQAFVAAAGPVMNLLIAVVALTVLVIMMRVAGQSDSRVVENVMNLLLLFGQLNIALAIFNLAPVPPLDGASILANFHRGYDRWLMDHQDKHGLMFLGYFILMAGLISQGSGIWTWGDALAYWYMTLINWVLTLIGLG